MRRYFTYEAGSYGELEHLAGITDREAFWRQFRSESAARAEIHAMIERRIAAGEFSPCWRHVAKQPAGNVACVGNGLYVRSGPGRRRASA